MGTKNQIKWEDLPREDLNHIPVMKQAGYTVEFNPIDIKAGRVSPINVPHHGINFIKGDKHVWSLIGGKWQTADLNGDGVNISIRYRNHRKFNTLKQIINQYF